MPTAHPTYELGASENTMRLFRVVIVLGLLVAAGGMVYALWTVTSDPVRMLPYRPQHQKG